MTRPLVPMLAATLLLVCANACSLAAHTKADRASGQSNLMAQSFAGKNACNPENHLRPFIIEWDATDMSSFEQHAANDIVFVHYEGCELRVLDECRNESIRGEAGAYKPAEWTSGSLETLDINNEAELYAKLPLGHATLGGRVNGGEKFHMEYYVAGTRTATRDAVYEKDLAGKYGCDKATHFVYGYNLGAFALASDKNIKAEVGGSAFGFGAGASETRSSSAEKKGGKLNVCDSESAKEVEGCKAPIRLTLRQIRPGENPEKTAMKSDDNDAALNAAGLVNAKVEMSEEARAHFESAQRKMAAGDGRGCLTELDAHDKLDAKHKSDDPRSSFGYLRGQCLMLAGKCDAGKVLIRKSAEQSNNALMGPEQIDGMVQQFTNLYCQGKLDDRDSLLKAITTISMGVHNSKGGVKACKESLATILKLKTKVKPKDAEDNQLLSLDGNLPAYVAGCFGRAGDCTAARKLMIEHMPKDRKEQMAKNPADVQDKIYTSIFEAYAPTCKKI
ncbi:MAG: hypothetical protein U0168_16470 [Nannocystaceae bacterium]